MAAATPAAPSSTGAPPPAASSAPSTRGATSGSGPVSVDHVDVPKALAAIVGASDRSEDDKKLDGGRHPAEVLAFFGVAPGMRVGEIAAGAGYTTELLARAVVPGGTVYAENPRFLLDKYAEKPFAARLTKPVNASVVRVDRELDAPFPPEAHDLDAVLDVLFYHDTVWLGVDRAAMNAAVFRALRHGGVYGIVDHSAKDGAGVADVKTLHRIEESVVRREIQAAGFELVASAQMLRNPDDARDWSASPSQAGARRGTSDRFVLKFVKP